uniref:Uncharacterized protein n=1 Tax=Arundo donax TaxID=35708 RepID=A0A0A9AID8_ARUDO
MPPLASQRRRERRGRRRRLVVVVEEPVTRCFVQSWWRRRGLSRRPRAGSAGWRRSWARRRRGSSPRQGRRWRTSGSSGRRCSRPKAARVAVAHSDPHRSARQLNASRRSRMSCFTSILASFE